MKMNQNKSQEKMMNQFGNKIYNNMITKYNNFINENREFAKTREGKSYIQEVIKFLTEKHGKSIEEAQKIVKDYFDEIGDYFLSRMTAKNVGIKLSQETNGDELTESSRSVFKLNETYQKDLTPTTYMTYQPNDKVLAVGWLDAEKDFPKGNVPEGFIEKLSRLQRTNMTKGSHECPFCEREKSEDGVRHLGHRHLGHRGSAELKVTDNGITYMAPELIVHYVKEHNYQPPKQYIDAVMKTR